jgi:hypothetical protein
MFTLNEKMRIINASADVKLFAADGTEITDGSGIITAGTPDTANPGVLLSINGFGKFNLDQMVSARARRGVLAVKESREFTTVVPTGVTTGDAVEVIVTLRTNRYQAEVLAAKHIGQGRTIKFQSTIITQATPTATNIADAISAGWAAYLSVFNIGQPFINVTNAGAVLTVAATTGYESISIERVEIKRVNSGIGSPLVFRLAATGTPVIGTEGLGTGKFLEESVRMATGANNDPYGVDTNGVGVDLRGLYTEFSFKYATSFSDAINPNGASMGMTETGIPALHEFVLFLNEATCNGAATANAAIPKIAQVARHRALAGKGLATAVTGLTTAQEAVQNLIKGANSVATVANFVS